MNDSEFFHINILYCKDLIVQFQKISIPTPWKVNGNSEGVGGLKSQNFKREVWGSSGNSRGVGGVKPKNLLWEGYGYFMEQHIIIMMRILIIIFQTYNIPVSLPFSSTIC